MSALIFRLLLHLCVWSRVFQANGIQNLRYPTRFDNNQWRFGKRQDFLTKSRFYMWKPALNPGQIYSNIKTSVPINYSRYGIQSPPLMAPFHQNYMFAIPTKVNHASYHIAKEIEDKRKPGNLHHITIINAIIPKPYMPTKPTLSYPTATFKNYRINNKQLYNQYLNNFERQNIENYNNQLQQTQNIPLGYNSLLATQLNKPSIEYSNVKNYIENDDNEQNKPVAQCGRNNKDDIKNSGSNILYYYCNNRITNYKNPTQQQIISVQSTTTLAPTTSTTTITSTSTTTEAPFVTNVKSPHKNFTFLTTEKPIFLPTPNTPLENYFVPITSATILKNSVTDSENREEFKLQRQKYRQNKYDHHRQTTLRYEDIKRQHQYTTAATYDNMKFHSFFTLEDAVTRVPEMQVFNDPYQAYRHARQQQINHQRQIATTTKIPDITTTTSKSKFKSFFDDLYDEDYPEVYSQTKKPQQTNRQRNLFKTTKIPDITTATFKTRFKSFFDDLNDGDYVIRDAHQYDYSLYNKPKTTSVYHGTELENQISRHNQAIHEAHKATEQNKISSVSESPVGRPTIKEHNFGLFKSVFPTTHTLPAITTYKPKKELSSTTHKIPSLTSYNSNPITFTSTLETIYGNQGSVTEKVTNNLESLQETRTTTFIPILTTTEKKSTRLTFKSPLSLRSTAMFKYPNQRLLQKTSKNDTSSTTTKATNTLKKVPKYQRQYKTKKLKQFKHLYTSTSTTTTTTTTTDIPTTIESQTKRMLPRLSPTTSTTEEPTTKKIVLSRSLSTTEAPKPRQPQTLTTKATKRRRVKPRTSTVSTTVSESSIRPTAGRRGSKRGKITKSEKDETEIIRPKVSNKSRRRLGSSSTTTKPLNSRTLSSLNSTSSSTATSTSATFRNPTTTTMKSIMRITNSKSRSKSHNDIRSSNKISNDVINEERFSDRRTLSKTTTSTTAGIPPLPIEIYFKKSQSAKI